MGFGLDLPLLVEICHTVGARSKIDTKYIIIRLRNFYQVYHWCIIATRYQLPQLVIHAQQWR